MTGGTGNSISSNIHGDKGQIGGADVTALFGAIILHPDLHPHLHRGVEDAIDRGAQDHEISDPYGHEKIQMIDGSRHHVRARVAVRGHGAGEIDPVHEASAEKCVQTVGIVGQDDLVISEIDSRTGRDRINFALSLSFIDCQCIDRPLNDRPLR